jgi:DNA-binding NtrC family response regulator
MSAPQNQARAGNGRRASAGNSAPVVSTSPEAKASLRILVVDGERSLRESCASVLEQEGYNVTACRRSEEAVEELKQHRFDIVLVELYMTPVSGLDLLKAALKANRNSLVIVITSNPSVESSVAVLRAGAYDYLPKPFTATQLQILIGRAAHTIIAAREPRAQQADTHATDTDPEIAVLGNCPAFRRAVELARKVAPLDASVFITGESGTGKELIAQFIHYHSQRSSKPMVAINCAALPETLLESEMFGHVKGAFTGAVRDKPGLLETANGGTLFLDELLELSKPIQAKLLRVIQDGVVRRVGSETTDAVVNVRFIAATNGDVEQSVKAGILREDLFYRLLVVPIHLPPLRERREDIPLVARHFLRVFWNRHRGSDSPVPRLTDAAIRALQAHPWRGNVRELQNVFERAVVLLNPGADIRPEDLPVLKEPRPVPQAPTDGTAPVPAPEPTLGTAPKPPDDWREECYHSARDRALADFERRYLLWLVHLTEGNITKAARLAGVERTTLYRLMWRHRVQRITTTVAQP